MGEDLLTRINAELETRLQELRPALVEYERLLSASGALGAQDGSAPSRTLSRAPPRATRAAKTTRAAPRRTAKAAQRAASPDATGTRRRRGAGPRGSAAGAIVRAGMSSQPGRRPGGDVSQRRAVRGAAQLAILAALEHGSHTVSELAVVTAMSGQNIRENLRRMLGAGAVTRAKREGKAAYALARGAEG